MSIVSVAAGFGGVVLMVVVMLLNWILCEEYVDWVRSRFNWALNQAPVDKAVSRVILIALFDGGALLMCIWAAFSPSYIVTNVAVGWFFCRCFRYWRPLHSVFQRS